MSDATLERKMLFDLPRAIGRFPQDEVWLSDGEDYDQLPRYSFQPEDPDPVSAKINRRAEPPLKAQYPRWLLIVFVGSVVVLVTATGGLLLSPFFASTEMVALLLLCASLGLAGLLFVVHKAEKVASA